MDIKQRVSNVINYLNYSIYSNVTRGLFEKDKLLFSFITLVKILENKNQIKSEDLSLFLSNLEVDSET